MQKLASSEPIQARKEKDKGLGTNREMKYLNTLKRRQPWLSRDYFKIEELQLPLSTLVAQPGEIEIHAQFWKNNKMHFKLK